MVDSLLNWQIGQRIRTEVLKEKRASYGEEICSTLSNKLVADFGEGYSIAHTRLEVLQ